MNKLNVHHKISHLPHLVDVNKFHFISFQHKRRKTVRIRQH